MYDIYIYHVGIEYYAAVEYSKAYWERTFCKNFVMLLPKLRLIYFMLYKSVQMSTV